MISESRVLEIRNAVDRQVLGPVDRDLAFAAALQREIAGSGEAVAWRIKQEKPGFSPFSVLHESQAIGYKNAGWTVDNLYLHPARCEKCAELEDLCRSLADWNEDEKTYRIRTYEPTKEETDERTRKCVAACRNLSDEMLEFAFEKSQIGLLKLKQNMTTLKDRAEAAEARCAQIEAETIEKCAKVCECYGLEVGDKFYPTCSRECATALRALKPAGGKK